MQSDKSKALIDSITGSINTLAAMTDATAKSAMFKDWLRAVSRFHHYSFNNQLLVLLQRPQAQRVAGFHTWKSLGRNVKKGAKGIAILAPCVRKKTAEEADKQRKGERLSEMRLCGFRVTHVFDIADTEGKPLPELDHRAQAGGEFLLPRLESAAAAMGIVLEYREETGSPNGWSEGGKVVVNATLSTAAKCGTLAHELAHEYLHWQSNRRDDMTREQRELEAEATSFAVLAHFGVEQPSDRYLASWDATAESITASLHIIRDAVHHILGAMDSKSQEQSEAEIEEIAA
jgi:hypothetical protein